MIQEHNKNVNGSHYWNAYIGRGSTTWGDERVQVDFNTTSTDYVPQLWLRKTAASGDAGGYLISYAGTYWGISTHTATTGLAYTVLANSSPVALSPNTWYTADAGGQQYR